MKGRQQVTFLVSGTRGDVQPHLALALGLQRQGTKVQIATHLPFQPLVQSVGLAFAPLMGNPSDLMTQPGSQSALTFDGNWWRSLRATLRFVHVAQPLYARLLTSAWQACRQSSALIVGLPSLWGLHIAEALDIPCLPCLLQPLSRTRAFPSAILPSSFTLGRGYNWLTHLLMDQLLWLPWRGVINGWRRTTFGRPAPLISPYAAIQKLPVYYGFSAQVVARPADWPSHHQLTGYWQLPLTGKWTPPTTVAAWLSTGTPTVGISLGSPGARREQTILWALDQALQATGLRGILSVPPDALAQMPRLSSLLPISKLDHRWLFPHLLAVIHHGGAGTTATALHAGIPMLVLPQSVDQFFWGKLVESLGVAPPALPQRSLTAPTLVMALERLLNDPGFSQRAQRLAISLQQEDGVETAVEMMGQFGLVG